MEEYYRIFMFVTAVTSGVTALAMLLFKPIKTLKPHYRASMYCFSAYYVSITIPFVILLLSHLIHLEARLITLVLFIPIMMAMWCLNAGISLRRRRDLSLFGSALFWLHITLSLVGWAWILMSPDISALTCVGILSASMTYVCSGSLVKLHAIKVTNPGELILSSVLVLLIILLASNFAVLYLTNSLTLYMGSVIVLNNILSILVLGAIYTMFLFDMIKRHKDEAQRDYLTNIYNRRAFFDVLVKRKKVVGVTEKYGVLVMTDIDKFKHINDTHGHDVGDEVIKDIARILKSSLREGDVYARMGGEEFAFYLHEADLNTALPVVERVRVAIERSCPKIGDISVPYTASFGLSPCAVNSTIEATLSEADKALYASKSKGRNCATCFDVLMTKDVEND